MYVNSCIDDDKYYQLSRIIQLLSPIPTDTYNDPQSSVLITTYPLVN